MILRYLTQVTSFWCWLRWRMLVTNMVKTVTDILSSSPEYFVPSICHQHRFTHTNLSLKWYFETRIGSFLLFNYFLINIFFFKLFLDYFYLRLEQFRYRYWYTFGLKWLQVSLCLVYLLGIIVYIGIICPISLPKRKRLDLQFFYSFLLYADK